MNPYYDQMMRQRAARIGTPQPQRPNIYQPAPQQQQQMSQPSMDPSMFMNQGGQSGGTSGGGSSGMGGWGGTLAAVAALEVARPHIKDRMAKSNKTMTGRKKLKYNR